MSSRIVIRATLLALAILPAACGVTDPDFEDDGVVRFVEVEGGCWVIDAGEVTLEPTNLTQEFQVDGLPVYFEAEERPDLASYCQVGQIVELKSIRVRED